MCHSWNDKVTHSRPARKGEGSMESHNVKWPGLGQRAEITRRKTKNNWGESSQSFSKKHRFACPAVIKKCRKLKQVKVYPGYWRDIKRGILCLSSQGGSPKMLHFNYSDLSRRYLHFNSQPAKSNSMSNLSDKTPMFSPSQHVLKLTKPCREYTR